MVREQQPFGRNTNNELFLRQMLRNARVVVHEGSKQTPVSPALLLAARTPKPQKRLTRAEAANRAYKRYWVFMFAMITIVMIATWPLMIIHGPWKWIVEIIWGIPILTLFGICAGYVHRKMEIEKLVRDMDETLITYGPKHRRP